MVARIQAPDTTCAITLVGVGGRRRWGAAGLRRVGGGCEACGVRG